MRAQLAESPVQLEQLQGVAVQPAANQETREVGSQEEERADVSLWPLKTDSKNIPVKPLYLISVKWV